MILRRLPFLLVLMLTACGDDSDGDPSATDDSGSADGGPGFDASPASDAGNDDGNGPLFASPGDPTSPPNAGGARCVESDADERGAPLGCEASDCRETSRACCVGRAECCTEAIPLLDLRFDTCTSNCVDGALFGSPLPTLVNGFSPGGDAEFDSGVVLDQRIDLRGEAIRLEADFVPPTTMCAGADCFQTVGVSIARNAPDSSSAHVRTIAGLLWSGGRIYLIVGERSIEDWSAESGGLWSLAINADGDVHVRSESVDETFDIAILPSEAYIVLHGHNVNPGGGEETAQLRSLTLTGRQCEMTRQWSERTSVEVGSGLTERLVGVTSPTSVRGPDGRLRIAYLRDGRLITTLRGDDETPSLWVDGENADDALSRPEGTVVAGPELANVRGEVALFYEVAGEILRATATDDEILRFDEGTVITDIRVPSGTVHAPTFASRGEAAEDALVVRVEWDDGRRSALAAFSITEDDGALVAQLHDLLPTDSLGDELGDPELFIRNRLYQLYVPYRRGTRWRLAHMTSADFLFWNIADDTALESGGADELFGPRAPDTVVSPAGVELFYERFDGSEQSIGRIFRRTPEIASLQSEL
ncbi:MAG: hypothetical protein ACI9KE_000365 [Polyangiales bacterium]|jgi:hypothetical protein